VKYSPLYLDTLFLVPVALMPLKLIIALSIGKWEQRIEIITEKMEANQAVPQLHDTLRG
jgi:hypothetical protein